MKKNLRCKKAQINYYLKGRGEKKMFEDVYHSTLRFK